jgi:D-alanyl-D-alanine carboxypeptidase (penicillin-binding protein 5/6)
MKNLMCVFLSVMVIAGVLFLNGCDTNTAPQEQANPSHTTDGASPEDENAAATEDIESISVNITAPNAYVMNIDSDVALYQKDSDEHIAPASTAKMLTALTVLETCSLDDVFTVSSEIDLIASDSSVAWLQHGDKLTVKQLLVALLLPSGNDAAYTLAVNAGRKVAGDNNLSAKRAVKAFMSAMNKKAMEVGATSSHFVTPDGYDADEQYTTAFDLAQIAKACLKHDVLLEIMGSCKINDTWANGRKVTYLNTNKLIDPGSHYYYSRAVGLKTGYSGTAGSCLVSAAIIDGTTYICVIMGASGDTRFSDSLTILGEIDPTSTGSPPNVAPSGVSPAIS